MKIIDSIIILATIWFAIRGLKKGIFSEIFSCLALIAGGWSAVFGHDFIAEHLHFHEQTSSLITMAIAFTLAVIAVLLLGKCCKMIFHLVFPVGVDKFLGLIFGGFKVLFLAGILFHFIAEIDTEEKLITPQKQTESITYTKCKTIADFLLPHIENISKTNDNIAN